MSSLDAKSVISNCIDGIRDEEGCNLNQMWVLINSHYGSNLSLETITQDYRMLWLEKGSISKRWILKRWLSFACHVLSVAQMEVRKTLVTVFHKKKNEIRDSFRPVLQNLCSKYLSGVDHIMIGYADLPNLVNCDEEVPSPETVQMRMWVQMCEEVA